MRASTRVYCRQTKTSGEGGCEFDNARQREKRTETEFIHDDPPNSSAYLSASMSCSVRYSMTSDGREAS